MEATELGLLVFMACTSAALCHNPASPIAGLMADHPFLQRLGIGVTMGLTMIAIIYSPMGKRSGAHFNPAVTFTFFRLGKIHGTDAFFYIVFQFLGGIAGAMLAGSILGSFVSAPSVDFAATEPGSYGVIGAFLAELLISGLIMGTVLYVTNHKQIMHKSGLFVGILFAIYITFEQPFSGTSMNPARSLGSAVMSGHWSGVWIYFTAPLLGMLLAGEVFLWTKGKDAIHCAKLYHTTDVRCIFRCGMSSMAGEDSGENSGENAMPDQDGIDLQQRDSE